MISLEIIDLTIGQCYSEVGFTNISSYNSLFSFIKLVLCRYPEIHPFHIYDQILLTFTHKSPLGPKRVARYCKYWMRCMCMCAKLFQSCPTLCNSLWSVACQAPLSMGFSRQEQWSVLPCPPPGDQPKSLTSPALPDGFFTLAPPGKPRMRHTYSKARFMVYRKLKFNWVSCIFHLLNLATPPTSNGRLLCCKRRWPLPKALSHGLIIF